MAFSTVFRKKNTTKCESKQSECKKMAAPVIILCATTYCPFTRCQKCPHYSYKGNLCQNWMYLVGNVVPKLYFSNEMGYFKVHQYKKERGRVRLLSQQLVATRLLILLLLLVGLQFYNQRGKINTFSTFSACLHSELKLVELC